VTYPGQKNKSGQVKAGRKRGVRADTASVSRGAARRAEAEGIWRCGICNELLGLGTSCAWSGLLQEPGKDGEREGGTCWGDGGCRFGVVCVVSYTADRARDASAVLLITISFALVIEMRFGDERLELPSGTAQRPGVLRQFHPEVTRGAGDPREWPWGCLW